MALSNGGIARRIYENADAALQLQVRSEECARKAMHLALYLVLAAKSQIFWDEMLGLSLPVTLVEGGRQFGVSECLYPPGYPWLKVFKSAHSDKLGNSHIPLL